MASSLLPNATGPFDWRGGRIIFRGISPKTFLDTADECHALVIGFCEVIAPWHPNYYTIDAELNHALSAEHHYYMFGRALGIIGWLCIVILGKRLLF
jgi:hypothetical protein